MFIKLSNKLHRDIWPWLLNGTNYIPYFNYPLFYFTKKYHLTYLDEYSRNKNAQYFALVRHPQAWMVSLYRYMLNGAFDYNERKKKKGQNRKLEFDDFVKYILVNPPKYVRFLGLKQIDYLSDRNGKLKVPFHKLENIESINDFFEKNNIMIRFDQIRHDNMSNGGASYDWKTYYDKYPSVVNIIYHYLKDDFVTLGYDVYMGSGSTNK